LQFGQRLEADDVEQLLIRPGLISWCRARDIVFAVGGQFAVRLCIRSKRG